MKMIVINLSNRSKRVSRKRLKRKLQRNRLKKNKSKQRNKAKRRNPSLRRQRLRKFRKMERRKQLKTTTINNRSWIKRKIFYPGKNIKHLTKMMEQGLSTQVSMRRIRILKQQRSIACNTDYCKNRKQLKSRNSSQRKNDHCYINHKKYQRILFFVVFGSSGEASNILQYQKIKLFQKMCCFYSYQYLDFEVVAFNLNVFFYLTYNTFTMNQVEQSEQLKNALDQVYFSKEVIPAQKIEELCIIIADNLVTYNHIRIVQLRLVLIKQKKFLQPIVPLLQGLVQERKEQFRQDQQSKQEFQKINKRNEEQNEQNQKQKQIWLNQTKIKQHQNKEESKYNRINKPELNNQNQIEPKDKTQNQKQINKKSTQVKKSFLSSQPFSILHSLPHLFKQLIHNPLFPKDQNSKLRKSTKLIKQQEQESLQSDSV